MTVDYAPPPDARLAASLLLLRDSDRGLEVLMMRRAERDGDLRSGAAVFPGGVIDRRDRDAHVHCIGPDDARVSARLGLAEGGLDAMIAAARESFEEVGVLLAVTGQGLPLAASWPATTLHDWRVRLQQGNAGIAEMCRATGLRLDLRGLLYFSHWLTPPGVPKRFDTRFFAVRAPQGQQARPDQGEAQEATWLTPSAALEPSRQLKLLPVTRRTLEDLARFRSVDDALAGIAAREQITLTMPRRAMSRRGPRIVLPDELPWAEIGRLDPEGRGDASCELVAGAVARLSGRVMRVTAPNPGPMTGPGTNTYLVGDGQAASAWTVIDPGPIGPDHLQAVLAAAAPGGIARILVSHTHRDHSPGAAALARASGAPVLGRFARHPEWQDESFAPVRQLEHGERLDVGSDTTLRVIHTPGHASNHLCYLLEQEKTLFTGDHVMQGSTVVINPPDGDMAAYLRSLGDLQHEDLEWLAPGHGFLVAQPQAALQGLIAHRLRREAKVLAAVQSLGPARLIDLVPRVYDDAPAVLHAVAARSLLAHLLKLQGDQRVTEDGDRWAVSP